MRPYPFTVLLCLLFLCGFFLQGPAARAGTADKYGGQVVLATISDPKTFNDITSNETSSSIITALIFEGLTTIDAHTLKVLPSLAHSWKVAEDGLTWTFFLRKDVLWNDGVPFTADDVVFTYNDLIYNPDIPSSSKDSFTIDDKQIAVSKVDTHTVQFVLPVKFAPFLLTVGQAILPRHKLEQSVKDGNFNFTWGIDTPPEEIVGTGPFKLSYYNPGERVVLARNPAYWKRNAQGEPLPFLDRIVYLIVQSTDTELLKFLDGETDAYAVGGRDYPVLKPKENEGNFTVYNVGPDLGTSFLFFNQNPGVNPKTGEPFMDPVKLSWFTDRRFRQAVAHAMDKKRMLEILMNGLGYEQHSAISQGKGYYHNPNVKQYGYDLEKARQLLKEAGFTDRDGDGFLEDKNGKTIEFTLATNAGADTRILMAGIIRSDLEQIGLKANFKILEFNTLVSKINATFDYDAVLLGLTGGGPDPHFGKNVWHSSGQMHMWNPAQASPATPWEKRVDEIFDTGVQTMDEEERKKLYDEFQLIVSEELPFIYTILPAKIIAVRNKFGNLSPSVNGGAFHNIEEIYVKPEFR